MPEWPLLAVVGERSVSWHYQACRKKIGFKGLVRQIKSH